MRKLSVFLGTTALLCLSSTVRGTTSSAQTSAGPVQQSSQLALPASAFPSDYTPNGNEAWPASRADSSTFHMMHSTSYTALGMLGGWYQYSAKILLSQSGSVVYAAPVEMSYLGTFYPDASAANGAVNDVTSNPSNSGPVQCTYGIRCVTFPLNLPYNGVTYVGLVRIVQEGNAVAEIRADTAAVVANQVSQATFTANLDQASRVFVQTVDSLAPPNTATSTPIPATSTPSPTPIPPTSTSTPVVPTATATATATPTSTPIPLFVALTLKHKTVKAGSRQSLTVHTLAGVSVRILVTFPDARHARHSGTADATGVYTWTYKQPGSGSRSTSKVTRVAVTVVDQRGMQRKATASYSVR